MTNESQAVPREGVCSSINAQLVPRPSPEVVAACENQVVAKVSAPTLGGNEPTAAPTAVASTSNPIPPQI
jgi:hypothetical protein